MNVTNLTAAILGLTMTCSYANLYDTEEELKERYGEPVQTEVRKYETKHTYNSGEYVITVEVGNETRGPFRGYTFFQSTRRLDGQPMTLKEITVLLNGRYGLGQWKSSGVDRWHMGSYAIAEYDRMDRTLIEKLRRR